MNVSGTEKKTEEIMVEGEWTHVCVWLSPFTVHWKPP